MCQDTEQIGDLSIWNTWRSAPEYFVPPLTITLAKTMMIADTIDYLRA